VYYSSHCPLDASLDAPDLGSCYDDYPTNGTGFYDTCLRLSRFEVLDGTVVVAWSFATMAIRRCARSSLGRFLMLGRLAVARSTVAWATVASQNPAGAPLAAAASSRVGGPLKRPYS